MAYGGGAPTIQDANLLMTALGCLLDLNASVGIVDGNVTKRDPSDTIVNKGASAAISRLKRILLHSASPYFICQTLSDAAVGSLRAHYKLKVRIPDKCVALLSRLGRTHRSEQLFWLLPCD